MAKETEVLELDEKQLVETIAKQVTESIDTEKIADEAATKAVEAYVKANEKTIKKDVTDEEDENLADDQKAEKAFEAAIKGNPFGKMDAKKRFYLQAQAFVTGEQGKLRALNQVSIALREKAGYANEGTSADGGYLVPDPEFDTTIYENLPRYGVVFKYGTTRQTDRNAIYDLSLPSDLQFTEVGEASVIASGKLTIGRGLKNLRKFGVIVPATEEVDEDSIVDYWNVVTQSLSRGYAKKADELTFTDTTSGIVHATGIITHPVSGAGTTISWDDLIQSEAQVEDDLDTSNFRWFMRKETYGRLTQTKASGSGEYLWEGFVPNYKNPVTPWGTPIVFTRVLPKSSTVGSNAAFAVFGDLSQYSLVNKRGMRMDMLTEAVVKDTSNNDFNLATQDAKAMRAIIRMLGRLPTGAASKFVVLGTGTVS